MLTSIEETGSMGSLVSVNIDVYFTHQMSMMHLIYSQNVKQGLVSLSLKYWLNSFHLKIHDFS